MVLNLFRYILQHIQLGYRLEKPCELVVFELNGDIVFWQRLGNLVVYRF